MEINKRIADRKAWVFYMGKQYRVGCKGLDESGRGIITFNNRKFAVPYMLPGEKGNIELVYRAEETGARLVSIDEASKDRVEPVCPAYEKCGGCQLMHMNYEAQLRFKQGKIEALFPKETAKGCMQPILSMEKPYHYRHKVYASFSRNKKGETIAGIYEENSHRIVRTKDCSIQQEQANRIIETVIMLVRKKRIEPYQEDRETGVLRHLYIRVGKQTGQIMVVLVTGSKDFPGRKQFAEELCKAHPEITTLVHNVNDKKTSMILGEKETVLFGKGYIEDMMCGFTFRISPKSFYQVNPEQTERLYETAVSFAGLTGKETVLDAYCGIGTISLIASRAAGKVIGVEQNPDAVRDARNSAQHNNCSNVEFICGDAGEYMKKCGISPDVVFLDPPRSGSDEKFLSSLVKAAPKRVVYISCNPQTLQRDVEFLKKRGYRVKKIQAVDCFCQTWHVECVVLMSRGDK